MRIECDVMVPMRDGVRLATDVYFPADAQKGTPVLLYRTPYSKDEAARLYGFALTSPRMAISRFSRTAAAASSQKAR